MSLDVYLMAKEVQETSGTGIFVREAGQTREITRAEWDERFPDQEPVVAGQSHEDTWVYTANITHNLTRMADEAGIYKALWRPEEIGVHRAAQLIDLLRDGLEKLEADPEHYKQFNPENGWGDYEGLVRFTRAYLQACEQWPSAEVDVSR